tara:strand:+ start:3535 stop:4581 length:1047 start_codon:yes stop_codon:yes gene_type:complete
MAISDDFADATIRHQVYLQRYKSGVVKDILALLTDVEDQIVADLIKSDLDKMPRRQLNRLLRQLQEKIKLGYKPVISLLNNQVEELAKYEKQWQMNLFDKVVPIDLDFIAPSDEQIIAGVISRPFQGRFLKDWYRGLPDGQYRRLKDAVMQGYVEGQTTQQIIQTIRGTRSQKGIIEQSRRGAETAVRTALSHSANTARSLIYQRNGRLIKSVEWVATLDGRTTAICRARDGKVYPTDAGPRPPAHAACRSTTIPVLKSLRELQISAKDGANKSTRASMNGQVSTELNYDRWLRQQPKEFQNEVLGISKAKLFRAGLEMDRFVDRKGNELNLNQLKQRESAAWAKAGL